MFDTDDAGDGCTVEETALSSNTSENDDTLGRYTFREEGVVGGGAGGGGGGGGGGVTPITFG